MDGSVARSARAKTKEKEKAPSYNWTDRQTLCLMQVLKDYHNKYGFNKTYDWAAINKQFEKRTGVDLTNHGQYVGRNKVEPMKKLWTIWCKLRFAITGAGWDKAIGMVTLTEERWDSFKKR